MNSGKPGSLWVADTRSSPLRRQGIQNPAAENSARVRGEETAETRVLTLDERVTPLSVPTAETRSHRDLTELLTEASGTTAVASRLDALRHDEAGRVYVFSWLIIVMAVFAATMVPILGGDGLARAVFLIAVAVTVAGYGTLLWSARSPETFNPDLAGSMFLVHTVAGHGVAYYFGVFSPCAAILAISLYVFAMGSSFRHAMAAYVNLAAGQALLAGLIAADVINDRGLVSADDLNTSQQVAIHLCVQMVLLLALLLGRMGRRRTVTALCELERAVREVSRRDALLHEAKLALARVEEEGPGRFTDEVLGSFRLGDVIGRGAMGEIYEAEHVTTGKPAAVKLLHSSVLSSSSQLARFVREARVAASLSARNLVQVLEVSSVHGSIPYLAMERLHGRDLWHILRERTTLPMHEVLELVEQVAAGLETMNRAGIVHRDLKPQNIFLTEDGDAPVWKVLDFGVSKLGDEHSSLTNGQVVGTPAYMAPEQARGLPVDHRADLYSLAIIVYRCLTGRPAFAGEQIPQVLYQVAHEMPLRPGDLAALPRDIDAVLAIAMAKDSRDRFDDVNEFAMRLNEAARGSLAIAVRDRATALIQRWPWQRLG